MARDGRSGRAPDDGRGGGGAPSLRRAAPAAAPGPRPGRWSPRTAAAGSAHGVRDRGRRRTRPVPGLARHAHPPRGPGRRADRWSWWRTTCSGWTRTPTTRWPSWLDARPAIRSSSSAPCAGGTPGRWRRPVSASSTWSDSPMRRRPACWRRPLPSWRSRIGSGSSAKPSATRSRSSSCRRPGARRRSNPEICDPQVVPLTARLERAFAGRLAEQPPLVRDLVLVAAVDVENEVSEILAAATVLAGRPVEVASAGPRRRGRPDGGRRAAGAVPSPVGAIGGAARRTDRPPHGGPRRARRRARRPIPTAAPGTGPKPSWARTTRWRTSWPTATRSRSHAAR